MKNVIIAMLFVTTVVFGGLYLREAHRATQVQANAENLRQDLTNLQSTLSDKEQQATRLQEQLEQTRGDVAVKNQEAAQLRTTLETKATNQPAMAVNKVAALTNKSNPFAAMFKSPEMKDMIKNSQKAVLGTMIDKNYAHLFSDLHLTPEQTAALKDLIMNKQMGAAEMGLSMLSNEGETNRAAAVEQMKQASDAADAQIKSFLGDDNYTQFQNYEKTMGDRMVVSGLKDQLAGGSSPLTDIQEQQLIQALSDERQQFKFTTDFSDKSKFNGDFASMFTEDKVNTYFQEMDKLNQQFQARASGILSADQLSAFNKYLSSQQEMQKAGMQMAAKMFAPAKGGE